MALKRKVEDLTTVEESYRPLYTERKEKDKTVYLLTEIEDFDAPDKLRTVRTEAGALRIENTKYKGQLAAFEGVDIDVAANALIELQATKDELEALKAGKGGDAKALDAAVKSRLTAETTPLLNKIKKLETDFARVQETNTNLAREREQRILDDNAISTFRELKINADVFQLKGEDADDLPDGILWARGRFKIGEDGKAVDRKTGVTIKDTLEAMRDAGQRPHWFGETGGTGSVPGNGTKSESNPWLPGAKWNSYQQSLIQAKDPQRAQALAIAAGCPDVDAPFHPKDPGMREVDRY